MPLGPRVQLDWEDLQALGAATAPPSEAKRHWLALMDRIPFDEVNGSTQRIMSAIFSNLREEPELPERDRLRGAFKYTWSRNTELLNGVRSVLASFEAGGIDYRILKGAAVQMTGAGLGSRGMGDIDLLVGPADVDRVVEVMLENGFRRGTFATCSGHNDAGLHGALNFNNQGCHVDVHVAGAKQPTHLLAEMMIAPASIGRAAGLQARMPPPELLALHAAVHGGAALGSTDFVQAVVDVSTMAPRLNQRRLVAAAKATQTLTHLLQLDAAVRLVGARPLGIHVPARERAAAYTELAATRVVDVATETSSVIRRVRNRQRGSRAQVAVARDFRGNRQAYSLWLRAGQFAKLERLMVSVSGGFLPEPAATCVSGAVLRPFMQTTTPGMTASTVAGSALDWRFRVRFAGAQRHVRLTVDSPRFDALDAFVFFNGQPYTRVVGGDPSTRSIYFQNLPESVEFSLRPLWDACTLCYQGLEDLQVRIDLGDDAR
jgi:hypothetical protein